MNCYLGHVQLIQRRKIAVDNSTTSTQGRDGDGGGWHELYGNMCEGARVVAHGIFSVVSGVVGKEKESKYAHGEVVNIMI